jgi:MraZ protein
MFLGEFTHSIDDKGRLAIPARYRKQLVDGSVVTQGFDSCLFLYPGSEWEKLAQKLAALPISQPSARSVVRLILGGAMAVEFDSQGRILVPAYLRAYAKIDKEAVITGLYNRLEIWNPVTWQSYKTKAEAVADKLAPDLFQLGI